MLLDLSSCFRTASSRRILGCQQHSVAKPHVQQWVATTCALPLRATGLVLNRPLQCPDAKSDGGCVIAVGRREKQARDNYKPVGLCPDRQQVRQRSVGVAARPKHRAVSQQFPIQESRPHAAPWLLQCSVIAIISSAICM